MDRARAKYYVRRFHSLSGLLPLAVFLAEHYFTNAHALHGAESFNKAAENLHDMPYLWLMEWVVVIGPLLFHSIYGFFITSEWKPNNDEYQHYQNLAYMAQRVTGVIIFVFVAYHVWGTRVQDQVFGVHVDYAYMANYFSPVWIKVWYGVGLAAVAYHLGNGLFNFAFKWGLVVSERAQHGMMGVAIATSVALFAIGMNILFAFH
jgi:succinate dehydrogenase / fumarate reductase cytochrome b subunit